MGCDRSGTTFLGSLIGAHSQCIVTPESQFKTDCYSEEEQSFFNPQKTFQKIKETKRFKIWDADISFTDTEYDKIKNYPDLILKIVEKYNINKQHKKSVKFWVDHTPINVEYVDLLKSFYPNAKFLHIIRDGRGVAASFKNVTWGPKSMYDIANFWLTKLAYGFAYERKYPQDILSVRYEDILENTENTIKKITDFIGIDYEPNMLEANGLIVPTYTKHQHELVGQKADKSRIKAWAKTLSEREIELFEYKTRNMLHLLGYQTLFAKPGREKRHERITFVLTQKYKRFLNKWKKRLKL
nr:sulfotransferase [Sulfurovum indicum]